MRADMDLIKYFSASCVRMLDYIPPGKAQIFNAELVVAADSFKVESIIDDLAVLAGVEPKSGAVYHFAYDENQFYATVVGNKLFMTSADDGIGRLHYA